MMRDGAFVVVWQSQGSRGPDTSGMSIRGRRLDVEGNGVGGEFQINTYS
jgi:hypothetical protein